MDYKDTINLPRTSFSMKANLSSREPDFIKNWYDESFYKDYFHQNRDQENFVLHSGPPYANGDIHLGHALNNILKDIIVKSKRMSGFNVSFTPGWDCHGLPIEHQVEKKTGKVGVKVTASEFREHCRAYAALQVEKQKVDIVRLGVIANWSTPYLTMSSHYEAKQFNLFADLVASNAITQGYKPVHWCLDCRSALAEAEVEYAEKESTTVDVAFLVDRRSITNDIFIKSLGRNASLFIPIWTTTPWTLPGNQALAVNPEISYALLLVERNTNTFYTLIAEDLIERTLGRWDATLVEKINIIQGESLVGLKCKHPYEDRQVPVIAGDHVTTEDGTGIVHTAPGHGQEDFEIGSLNKLPLDCLVNPSGLYLDEVPYFSSQHIYKAQPLIIDKLVDEGTLFATDKFKHSYPHCWRHKTPLIFRATPQWFISLDNNDLRGQILKSIPTVEWLPYWGKERIHGMVEGRPDWCISRQRYWGVPIPLFINTQTGKIHPESEKIIRVIAKKAKLEGIEAWHNIEESDLGHISIKGYEKLNDVMDVWLDSGLSHSIVFDDCENVSTPADLYLEGSDQHRGWFQSSLITSVALNGAPPYRQVLTHGFTVDEQGRKMSKSLGNVIKPQEIYRDSGADILRLWAAATDYRGELRVSTEILKRVTDAYRRIRNTFRFLLGNLSDFDNKKDALPYGEIMALDREIIKRTDELQKEVMDHYEKYEFHLIFQKIHHFCSKDLGGFYFDILKDRLYTCATNSKARRSAQSALHVILESLVRMAAPILSFTADEVWRSYGNENKKSVLLDRWLTFGNLDDQCEALDWNMLENLREQVLLALEHARSNNVIGSSLDAEVIIVCDNKDYQELELLAAELKFIFITSKVDLHKTKADLLDGKNFLITVKASSYEKCTRCWHRNESVSQNHDHPELCSRCVINITHEEERRFF
jgi:isoleucyl-tRNA synthetase